MEYNLAHADRMLVLRDLALLETPNEPFFQRLTEMASKVTKSTMSLVSMVAADFNFFKASYGLPPDFEKAGRMPLNYSFCRHVIENNTSLVIGDSGKHPDFAEHPGYTEAGIVGYVGMPINLRDGKRLGTFCVIDTKPREWNDTEIALIRELSEIISHEIDLRAMAKVDPSLYQSKLEEAHKAIEKFLDELDVAASQVDFLAQVRGARAKFQI